MNWLVAWWRSHQRTIDIALLWPSCRRAANGDLAVAREIFMVHCAMDHAWRNLTQDQILTIVNKLR